MSRLMMLKLKSCHVDFFKKNYSSNSLKMLMWLCSHVPDIQARIFEVYIMGSIVFNK